ncbi:MAG: hypothetical protein QF819_10240 [Gemmatimonadota bacterium]|jgi:rhodanese-related sulfurtransferase|nr:hypothetical protein [Gemmatimonadota bacterium]MDP6803528.1 hypothetical protein [Gemmatimonadota bacterium]
MNRALRESVLIAVIGAAAGLGGNLLRSEPLPLTGALGPPSVPEAGAGLVASDASEALDRWDAGALFLDVRSAVHFAAGHAVDARSLPAADAQDAYFSVLMDAGLDLPLFVYGAGPDSHAVRSVAAMLGELGHQDVSIWTRGLGALEDAGVPVDDAP